MAILGFGAQDDNGFGTSGAESESSAAESVVILDSKPYNNHDAIDRNNLEKDLPGQADRS